ncbi:MAG: tripartite motif-containing protein 71 [Fusobacteriaceae bacterium]|jgi:hypothetical protein|nr:uncharacterized protein [Fusobacteriales bacterium]MDN5305276.1 tripartite motif-containing protein 71 [Fusobacteriaceae bacterium]
MKKLYIFISIFFLITAISFGKSRYQFFKSKVMPKSVTVSDSGEIFIVDSIADQIMKYNKNGRYMKSYYFDDLKTISDIFYYKGKIYILSLKEQIYVIDTNGNLLEKHQYNKGKLLGELNKPTSIYVDDEYITIADTGNNRIQLFTTDFKIVRDFGYKGLFYNAFSDISSVFRINDYFLVSDKATGEVKVFDKSGIYERNIQDEKGNDIRAFIAPNDIFVYNNYIYIVDAGASKISVYNKDFKLLYKFGTKGTGKTEFGAIKSIWVNDKYFYIADTTNSVVKVFESKDLKYRFSLGVNKFLMYIILMLAFIFPIALGLEILILKKHRKGDIIE